MGDIVFTTDNPYFIKGSHKDHSIITYEKGLAKPAKMTIPNITSTIMKGFGSGVGGFSNTATILYAMASMFNRPNQQDQHDEIMHRIKLLREIVGQEIDRIKGADKPSLPAEWKKFQLPDPDDTPEQRTAKFRANAMVVSKKPYFFRYLYPELNQQFKQFEASYNQISLDMFGMKIKKLFKLPSPTQEQRDLIRRYQKYSPLITSDCTMNRLCREFENVDFDIQFDRAGRDKNSPKAAPVSMLPTFTDMFPAKPDPIAMTFVRSLYKDYISRPQRKRMTEILSSSLINIDENDFSELRRSVYHQLISSLQARLADSTVTVPHFLNLCYHLSHEYSQFNWAFAWDILGDSILSYIDVDRSLCPVRTTASDPDAVCYLGCYYKLVNLPESGNQNIEDLFSSLFYDSADLIDIDTLEPEEVSE